MASARLLLLPTGGGLRLCAALLLGSLLWASAPATAEAAGAIALFGRYEKPLRSIKPFTKWLKAKARHKLEKETLDLDCDADSRDCYLRYWARFIEEIRDNEPMTQMILVNRKMNKSRYILDIVNWGVNDYWETPRQFLSLQGDCEDYAIIKFYSLLRLGFSNDDMRIVVLKDLNLKIAHAVLVVYFEGKPYVLDNQVQRVVPAATIRHYRPYYAVNRDRAWRYVSRG